MVLPLCRGFNLLASVRPRKEKNILASSKNVLLCVYISILYIYVFVYMQTSMYMCKYMHVYTYVYVY